MALTLPLTLPSTPRRVRFGPFDPIPFTVDPYTSTHQFQEYPGDYMRSVEVQIPPIVNNQVLSGQWIAFMLSCRGRKNTFFLGDPTRTLLGAGGGGLVNGASQTGLTLVTDGWANSTLILRRGDIIQIGSGASAELKYILTETTSDGSGNATLDIWPRIRSSPADGSAVVTANPVGVFRLAENERFWDADFDKAFGFSFTAEQAV